MWHKLKQNAEIYLTILVALGLIIADIIGVVAPEIIAAGTLATLALLAYSNLNSREEMEAAKNKTEALTQLIEDRMLGKPRAKQFFIEERPNYSSEFAKAKKICISGVTLSRTVRDYLGVFEDRLKNDASIQLIIIDPESVAAKQAALRSYRVTSDDFYPNRIRPTVELANLLISLPEITGEFLLYLLPFTPSFGLTLIDPDEAHGKIYVEIYQHKSVEPNPSFKLERQKDPEWYDFFAQQFSLLAASSRPAPSLKGTATKPKNGQAIEPKESQT